MEGEGRRRVEAGGGGGGGLLVEIMTRQDQRNCAS